MCLDIFQFPECPAGGAAVVLLFRSAHAANCHFPPFFFPLLFLELRKFHISGLKQKSQKLPSKFMANKHIAMVQYALLVQSLNQQFVLFCLFNK